MFPTFSDLIKYLRSRCVASELASGLANPTSSKSGNWGRSSPKLTKAKKPVALVTNSRQPNTAIPEAKGKPTPTTLPSKHAAATLSSPCPICSGEHRLTNCLQFSTATADERFKLLRSWRGCRNCLRSGHSAFHCPSRWRCRFCRKKHHSLLHLPTNSSTDSQLQAGQSTSSSPSKRDNTPASSSAKPMALNTVSKQDVEVMLGTAVCHIYDRDGNAEPIRLAIDSGSHFSFITRSFAERLGLDVETHSTGIWGIGETPLPGFKGRAICSLSPVQSGFPKFVTSAVVVDTITSPLPGFETEDNLWHPYSQYPLADPQFWITRPIDFLLGCDLFSDILSGEVISISSSLPKLLGTIFGFIVLGRLKDLSEASSICALHVSKKSQLDSLHEELHRFWELEDPPQAKMHNPEDGKCETLFRSTHFRLPDGRYVVRLPFKVSNPELTGTYGLSLRRLEHLERRLERNSTIRTQYNDFMTEYLSLGHMELAKLRGNVIIPHHCVVKDTGIEKKLRVVFDAAARTSSGSLNELLLVGPKLQASIVTVLINFRRHRFVFTADIVKMYRQILVHPEDRKFQHILWRFKPSDAVQEFQLKTLSYGQTSAPYLAIRTLKQLKADEGLQFPLAAQVIENDMYIDDLATGSPTLEGAIELRRQVISLFTKGCFELSKWASNDSRILADGQCKDLQTLPPEPVTFEPSDDPSTFKILGLQWDSSSDTLSYKISPPEPIFTKRAVLSAVAKIYDPLGYLGPVVVLAKELIQEAWKRDLSWDTIFPQDLQDKWSTFIDQLPILTQITVPRWVAPPSEEYQMLIFADASERAYCAAAYLRSTTDDGSTQALLLLAKTKLAPVKTLTIPRLELCAALLAIQVWELLQPFCDRLSSRPTPYFFSDSMVVLAWLQTPSYKMKIFVANRVEKILESTSRAQWRHVASEDNPSDIGSRGLTPDLLLNNTLWFNGPCWEEKVLLS